LHKGDSNSISEGMLNPTVGDIERRGVSVGGGSGGEREREERDREGLGMDERVTWRRGGVREKPGVSGRERGQQRKS